MKKIFFFILLLASSVTYAAVVTPTYTLGDPTSEATSISGEFFSAYNVVGAAYVYDESAGTDNDDGELKVFGFPLKTLTFDVGISGVTSIDIRIEGRSHAKSTWSDVYTKSFTTSTGANADFLVNVIEHWDWLRVGVKYTGGAPAVGDTISVYFTCRNQK